MLSADSKNEIARLGFSIQENREVEEIGAEATFLKHIKTGAKVIHIGNDDPNNLFSINFPTIPQSSNGVAHIVEHTVLSGSQKYPVSDTFFSMIKRSMATFMNALTGQDATYYPASSMNEKDFYNLLDVYVDSVFFPKLSKLSFMQEGHRLELDDFGKPSFQGIVYNEMKGALSDPDERFFNTISKALFPESQYGYNEGGDPKKIPFLTYQQFLDFHQEFYNPSRCTFFFYGNLDLLKHLQFINKRVLDLSIKKSSGSKIRLQSRFNKPIDISDTYPLDNSVSEDEKTFLAMGWLTTKIENIEEVLAFRVLNKVLFMNDASPMNQALLNSGLGKETINNLDYKIREISYIIGIKEGKKEHKDQFTELVWKVLNGLVQNGIPSKLILSAFHSLEYSVREITKNFGFSLLFRVVPYFMHSGDLGMSLSLGSLLESIKPKILEGRYLESIIKKYLLDNQHRVTLVLHPDPHLDEKESKQEQLLAVKCYDQLNQQQKLELKNDLIKLNEYQKKIESLDTLDCLPRLNRKDIPARTNDYKLDKYVFQEVPIYHHAVHTNDILYVDAVFDFKNLSKELLPYVSLFTDILTEIGTSQRSYIQVLEDLSAHTGGINADCYINEHIKHPNNYSFKVSISGESLGIKRKEFLDLLFEIIGNVSFHDQSRLKQLLLRILSSIESEVVPLGNKYIINYATRNFTVPSAVYYFWRGIGYLKFLRRLIDQFDQIKDKLIQDLQAIKDTILQKNNLDLIISSSKSSLDDIKPDLESHLRVMGDKSVSSSNKNSSYNSKNTSNDNSDKNLEDLTFADLNFKPMVEGTETLCVASQVAFTSKVIETIPYTHKDFPALIVLSRIISNDHLHKEIREQGGAYGCDSMCMHNIFVFQSYRDPHIDRTFKIYQSSYNFIQDNITERKIEESILQIIAGVDEPVSPGQRGNSVYFRNLRGLSNEDRNVFRQKLLNLSIEDVKKAAFYLDKPGKNAIMGGAEILKKEGVKDYETL